MGEKSRYCFTTGGWCSYNEFCTGDCDTCFNLSNLMTKGIEYDESKEKRNEPTKDNA